MRKIKKFVIAIVLACMLLVPTASVASAEDLANPDNWTAFFEMIEIDINDPQSIKNIIKEIQEGGLSAAIGFLGLDISDILDELYSFLGAFESETTTRAPEPTTEPPTTAPPVTEPPTYEIPTYNPTPQEPIYTQPVETLPPETVPPVQIYTEPYTTAATFNPVVQDDLSVDSTPESPAKTALGFILLAGSGIGVIVVVLALKRNKI